ncbi:hypothetical protein J26TS2_34580 [Shouchella clausii]|uniref:T7SS effector LXG polymorphic toxin n=1 Tax=Shouchella tritolerans TaxID=2979466 RepID=UPI0007886C6F|nr:T7SS effector LXG polymorphic toxin [Shouchella tritolerans]GIN13591.1 hypothetical protein J26TS2_34580 [Shouchella clausii]
MKVLDVQEVINGIDKLVDAKKEDIAQLEAVESSIRKIHNLHSLQGEGGEAIKNHFSQLHLPALRFFVTYLEQYIEQLGKMKNNILNFEASNALLRQDFLTETIPNGINRIKQNAEASTEAINSACASIQDLVYTGTFTMDGVQAWADTLKQHAQDTADRLEELDAENINLANEAEATLTELMQSTEKVINWTTGGPIASPAVQEEIDRYFKENDVYYNMWSEAMELASIEDPTLMGAIADWFSTAGTFYKGMDVAKGIGALAVIASGKLKFEKAGNGIFRVKNHQDWVKKNGVYNSKLAAGLNSIMRKFGNKNSPIKLFKELGRLNNQPTNILRKLVNVDPSQSSVTFTRLFRKNASGVAINETKAKQYVARPDLKATAKEAKKTFVNTFKRVPYVGTIVSAGSNVMEAFKDENKEKSAAEKTGRVAAGFAMDAGVAGLTAGGAAIGSMILPGPGTVIGGAVGATVGIIGSIALDEKVKDLGEKVGRQIDKGVDKIKETASKVADNIGDTVNSAKKFVTSWFK